MTFDLKIKAYRKTLGMTQRAFSKYLGISLRSLNYWESGRILPDALLQRIIEGALDAAVADYRLRGIICPLPDKDTMRERYSGVGRRARSKSTSVGSGTSGFRTGPGSSTKHLEGDMEGDIELE